MNTKNKIKNEKKN